MVRRTEPNLLLLRSPEMILSRQRAAVRLIFLLKLAETNVLGILAEALAADVDAVLADKTTLVSTYAATASTLCVSLVVRVKQLLGTHVFLLPCFCDTAYDGTLSLVKKSDDPVRGTRADQ